MENFSLQIGCCLCFSLHVSVLDIVFYRIRQLSAYIGRCDALFHSIVQLVKNVAFCCVSFFFQ